MLMLRRIEGSFRRLQARRIQPSIQLRGEFGFLGSPK